MRSLSAYTAALTCVATANALAPIALAFAVLDLGGSVSDVGWILAARTIPQLLLLLVGGVVADRCPRYLVVLTSSAAQAVTFGAAGGLLAAGSRSLPVLAILVCANGIATAFTYPAISGMLPQLVSVKQLPQATSVTGTFTRCGAVLGMVAGGLVAMRSVTGSGLLVAAVMMAGAGAAVWSLRRVASGATATGTGIVRGLAEGWREFAGHSWLWVTVTGFCAVNLVMAGAWMTIGPVIAEQSIGRAAWGLAMGAFAAGLGLGHLVLFRLRPRYLLAWGIAASAAAAPAVAVLTAPRTAMLVPLSLLAGVGLGFFSAAWRTTLGQRIPTDRLSRVSSIDGLGSFVAIPVGQILAGRLAEATSPRAVALAGAIVVAVAVAAMLGPRSVRRLPNVSLGEPDRQAAPEELARSR
ncbi:MAG TPA: MFS transporter [Candidatus Limnocylindrales bacterium]